MEVIIHSWKEFCDQWKQNDSLSVSYNESAPIAIVGQLPKDQICATLLLSRLPTRNSSNDLWLSAVRDGLYYIKSNGWSVIASNGMTGWEYVAWYASKISVPLVMILLSDPISDMMMKVRELATQLKLSVDSTTFVMPIPERKLSKKERYQLRDQMAFFLADYRIPIAIRPKGRWAQMSIENDNIIDKFRVSYPKIREYSWRKKLDQLSITHRDQWNEFLFHWTRGCYGKWIGETTADYFESLTANQAGNPRDGLSTLRHIVSSGLLRGQERMIRVKKPMISLTTITPAQIHDYIHYRPTLKRLTFEPYGIAIPKVLLEQFGARPVIYGDDECYESLSTDDKPYFQYKGSSTTDWQREDEWRLFGDIDLHTIREQIFLITVTEHEADQLRDSTLFRVESMETMQ